MKEEYYKDIIEKNIYKYFKGIDIKKYYREYTCENKRFDFLIECSDFDIIIECKLSPHYEDKGQLLLYKYLYSNKFEKSSDNIISILWYLEKFSIREIDRFIDHSISIIYKNNIFITHNKLSMLGEKIGNFNKIYY